MNSGPDVPDEQKSDVGQKSAARSCCGRPKSDREDIMSLLAPVRRSPTAGSVITALRYASSSGNAAPSSSKSAAASSVQRADEQLALRQRQQAAMRRSGRQMDIMSANIQVLGK